LLLAGCSDPGAAPKVDAAPWPEADALFHSDSSWIGGDRAYSVALGDGRILWLFGDSFVSPSGSGQRSNSTLVHNTIALQQGSDPTTATFETHWNDKIPPSSFFPDDGNSEWLWPGQPAMVGGKLIVFLIDVRRSTSSGPGFTSQGWDARLIDPTAPVGTWSSAPSLAPPQNPWKILLGTGGVQVDGDFLIAYGTQEQTQDQFVARWPVDAVLRGDLSTPSWWDGTNFTPEPMLTGPPFPLILGSATEFSVSKIGDQYFEVETRGFGASDLSVRAASALTGPWSASSTVFHPPESDRADTLVYGGKAHPEVAGADLVATYATDSTDFSTRVSDLSIYWPRFVKLTIR
jgi:hypothetical protein